MKKILLSAIFGLFGLTAMAQGWPSAYGGVMLQGFYWDSYSASRWTKLEANVADFAGTFDLIWIPQSGKSASGGQSMGYDDLYWFSNYNSSFGNEAELRSMISTFKANGIGTIADVVINHRGNLSTWVDFPAETYKGVTYQLQSTDICADDDGGSTKTWATKNGYSLSSNNDTGEDWSGMRDLDHKSSNVQTCVKAYLDFLLNDLGYAGVRYDMTKGYAGSYTGLYNAAANPTYSVGEYWDGNVSTVKNWLNATKVNGNIMSAAFDFPFRYTVRDAINNSNWSKLSSASLMSDASYRRYSVTFVENHDTEYRSSSEQQDPIKADTLAANAWLLAMPGTPCVFYKHFLEYPAEIKAMVAARKFAGITNTSTMTNYVSSSNYYGSYADGTNCQLLAVVGKGAGTYTATAKWVEILSGYHYRYFIPKSTNTAYVDLASGTYESAQKAKLTAVSSNTTTLVYTLDGSTPTASSTQVQSGTSIDITQSCTLTVGLLINGAVSGIITREYVIEESEPFEPYDVTVYVNVDQVGWSKVNFWCWDQDGNTMSTSKSWPGDNVTATTTADGKTWYYQTYNISSADMELNFVFSTGTGSPQTVDCTGVTEDTYYEVSSEKDGSKYLVNKTSTGIDEIITDKTQVKGIFDLQGRKLQTLQKGLNIVNGKKVFVK